jgi:hypothetical protein
MFLPTCGTAMTENVSYRGLLLQLDAAIILGQLYRVEVKVGDEQPIALHLVPLRRVVDPSGLREAIGVRLLGHEPRWERFVGDLQALSGRRIVAAKRAPESPAMDRVAKGVG